jgi:hypothetical protein
MATLILAMNVHSSVVVFTIDSIDKKNKIVGRLYIDSCSLEPIHSPLYP